MEDFSLVEQVVVSVKLNNERNEIELLQATEGVQDFDLAMILEKAASIEFFDGRYESNNFFGFQLPSGYSLIGRLTPQFFDDSYPNSDAYYFECLIADYQNFYFAGANPRTFLASAMNTLEFAYYRPGRMLRAFPFTCPQELLRKGELTDAANRVGVRALTALLESVIQKEQTVFVTDHLASTLISCVFSLLPVFSRRAMSFAADLKFRNDPSIRVVGVTKKRKERLAPNDVNDDVELIDLRDVRDNYNEYFLSNKWCSLIEVGVLQVDDILYYFYGKLIEDMESRQDDMINEEPVVAFSEIERIGNEWLNELNELNDCSVEEEDGIKELEEGEEWKDGNYEMNSFDPDRYAGPSSESDDKYADNEEAIFFDEEKQISKESTSLDSDILRIGTEENALEEQKRRFSPADALVNEFPTHAKSLQLLDNLILQICWREGSASIDDLDRHWKSMVDSLPTETTSRVRSEYIERLAFLAKQGGNIHTIEYTEMLLARLEVFRILSEKL